MERVLLIIIAIVAAMALAGFSMQRHGTPVVDRDADGEPDEADGPSKGL